MRFAILALACACGSGVEVKGLVGNRSFSAKQATVVTSRPDSQGNRYPSLFIANRDQLCGYLGGALNLNYTDLLIVTAGSTSAPGIAEGTYPIGPYDAQHLPPPGRFAMVQYYAIDCRVRYQSLATSGTVTIRNVSLDDGRYSYEGGFEAAFGANGGFSATFEADACNNDLHAVIPISNCP